MNKLIRLSVACACIYASVVVFSGELSVDAFEFKDDQQAARYNSLIQEFRCPKCLNTNLAGSDAPIAKDLRRAVHRLINEGKTDQEIREFMLSRYGDFVLYKPRLTPATLMLWFSPLVLLLVLALVILQIANRKSAVVLSDEDRSRIKDLPTE